MNSSPENIQANAQTSAQADPQSEAKAKRAQVLRARAKLLARSSSAVVEEDYIELLEFELNGEHYGFELSCLREVCTITDVTHIPCSPPFVRGVINVRGQIIPLIDMLILLNIGTVPTQRLNKAIILQRDKLVIGLLADEVLGATKIPTTSLQRAFAGFEGQSADYLRGVTKEKLIFLDGRKMLDDPQLNP